MPAPEQFTDTLVGVTELFEAGRLDELYARLFEVKARMCEYEKVSGRKARYSTVAKQSKLRDALFTDKSGKGKGRFINKVMKSAFRSEELTSSRRPDGSLAVTAEEVDPVVHGHFSHHFASKVSLKERWGTREALLGLRTDNMPSRYAKMVQESYSALSGGIGRAAREGHWWASAYVTITGGDVLQGSKALGKCKAPGQSKVTADMVVRIDAAGLSVLAYVFEGWRVAGAVPDVLNTALIRLLPKTSQGLADLAKCRPVALMEHFTKIYEHIVIGRVTGVVLEHGMLHPSQYGATSCTGGMLRSGC